MGQFLKDRIKFRMPHRPFHLSNKRARKVYSRLWFFQWSCMDARVGLWRKLRAEELMLLNCGVGEDSRVPWTARRSNQSILKEISPGCSLEAVMLKLKLQYFGPLMRRVDSLEKTHAGRDWGQEEKGTTEDEMAGWHHWLDGCESEWTLGVGDGQGGLVCCDSWGRKESDMTQRLNWTEESKGNKSKCQGSSASIKWLDQLPWFQVT